MKEHAKKALKHDISVFGKTVPTLAIAVLFLIGGGTAATVSIMSNTVSADVTVERALDLRVHSVGGDEKNTPWGEEANTELIGNQGTTTQVEIDMRNNADVPITATTRIVWSDTDADASSDDFQSARVRTAELSAVEDNGESAYGGWYDLLESNTGQQDVNDDEHKEFVACFGSEEIAADVEERTQAEVTLADNVDTGEYDISVEMVDPSVCPTPTSE
jgi:hypothetical protein